MAIPGADQRVDPLLDARGLDGLRTALADFTVDGVHAVLGPVGQAAEARGDLDGVALALDDADGGAETRSATLIRLFLLGLDVTEHAARRALAPLPLDTATAAGLVERSVDEVRARIDLRPYAEVTTGPPAQPWWVVSDLGSDVRPGPLAPDHVVGIGNASTTLAQLTPRGRVGSALDIGTGCGVQALHLGGHSGRVCATDVSTRALRFAATTAALSGQDWDLRRGSLLDPVRGERFDLVVANPPFVVSDGSAGHEYRDSGLAGDEVCRSLVSGLPDVLAPHASAVLLANWIVPADGDWRGRVGAWFGDGVHAWVWQREMADLGEYVSLWLRDAGEQPGTPRWRERYAAWVRWLQAAGAVAVGMGSIVLWDAAGEAPIRELEDVPQPLAPPLGGELPAWLRRRRWLATTDDPALLAAVLRPAPDLARLRDDVLGRDGSGWSTVTARLRLGGGLRWEIEVDDAVAALVAGCSAGAPLATPVALLAGSLDLPAGQVAAAVLPVVRDLVGRGVLLPDAVTAEVAS